MKLIVAWEQFIQECRDGTLMRRSEKTIVNYQNSLDLLLQLMSLTDLGDLNEAVLRQFIQNGESVRHWSPNTSLTYRKNLQPFTKWCITKGYLPSDPFTNIPRPKLKKRLPEYYSDEQVEKMLYITDMEAKNIFLRKRNLSMLAILMMTGMRKGELLGLRLRDVDFEHNHIRVRAENAKDAADRVVPMHRGLVVCLKEYVDLRNAQYPDFMALWLSDHGKAFSEHGWNHFVDHLSERVKFPVKTHKFRHTFATNYYRTTRDIIGLQQLLGHSDVTTTMIYAHVMPENLRAAIEANPLGHLL